MAVVGFDNWEIIAEAARPPLTTVDLKLHDVGRAASADLLAMLAGECPCGLRRLPCSLIVRQSCGATAFGASGDLGPTDRPNQDASVDPKLQMKAADHLER